MSAVMFKDVSKRYHTKNGETYALKNVNFSVADGEFVAIVGPSGCGKSTILSLVAGLLTPSSGEIYIEGRKTNGKIADSVGYMLQHDHLFPWCSVWDNILIGLRIKHAVTPQKKRELADMLEQYGLKDFSGSSPMHLSGGMRQRAALIRTLATEPKILLLDEPFAALDYQTRIAVSDDIASIIRNREKTAILVTHDIAEAISISDRVLVMSRRPGTIKSIHKIELSSAGMHVTERRSAHGFGKYFDTIWKELYDVAEG